MYTMIRIKKITRWGRMVAVFALTLLLVAPAFSAPRFIFLFIGDGMGFPQVELSDLALQQLEGNQMRIARLPLAGKAQTESANAAITDSGAAGTALASGIKTNNGVIGRLPDGTPVEPVSLKLLREGMKIAVMASVPANHATPAPFYSHAENRNSYDEIGMQFPESGVHFLAGRYLLGSEESREKMITAYREHGIAVVDFDEAADIPHDQRMALLDARIGSRTPHRGDLAEATALAIERLKENPKGFFMMIEGGAIDWACHANQGWVSIEETLAMDRAVEVAYQFYLQHPEETLLLVTADHETGGLGVQAENVDAARLRELEQQRDPFRIAMQEALEGVTIETVLEAMKSFYGITEISEEQRRSLEKAVERGHRNDLLRLTFNIAQEAAGITWSTGGHTPDEIPVYAIGPGAELFQGHYHLKQIPANIFKAAVGRPLFEE